MRRMLGRPNRSLALYIALPFVAMVLLWQTVSLWLAHDAIDQSATRAIETELLTGRRIFEQLLVQRAERLGEAARLLSSDYGFRSAIASGDTSTLQDALLNQGQRIGAALALYVDPDWRAVATTPLDAAEIAPLLAEARALQQVRSDAAGEGAAMQVPGLVMVGGAPTRSSRCRCARLG